MTLKLAKFCDDPKKTSTKSSYPPKIFIFLKNQKNIEIQNFEPRKIARAYVCVKISEYPPAPSHTHTGGGPRLQWKQWNKRVHIKLNHWVTPKVDFRGRGNSTCYSVAYSFLFNNCMAESFRVITEFRISRLTFHRKSASKCWIMEITIALLIYFQSV